MAVATFTAKAFLISRVTELSLKHFFQAPPHRPPGFSHHHHHLLLPPLLPVISFTDKHQSSSFATASCLISGVDGGGVSDEFVFTMKSGFWSEFSAISDMLKRIEPLDTSIFSYGISNSAKDSMKQTISAMLGLLPSDQFSVTVQISELSLDLLIVSSIITGYTLWNAEYRISLMRNFEISPDNSKGSYFSENGDGSDSKCEETEGGGGEGWYDKELERNNIQIFRDLSPEALHHIQQLESKLASVEQELHFRKQENLQMEYTEKNNNLLEYLRSLESDMITELSTPSLSEVEDIIHQLAQNLLKRFFKDEIAYLRSKESYQDSNKELCGTISTPRDYLAKQLFWCMLLGHHLRGFENRLQLSCVVGLL